MHGPYRGWCLRAVNGLRRTATSTAASARDAAAAATARAQAAEDELRAAKEAHSRELERLEAVWREREAAVRELWLDSQRAAQAEVVFVLCAPLEDCAAHARCLVVVPTSTEPIEHGVATHRRCHP